MSEAFGERTISSWRTTPQRLRLEGEICPHCGEPIFPPRDICTNCGDLTKPIEISTPNGPQIITSLKNSQINNS